METTRGLGFRVGIMEKKMETTEDYRDYIGVIQGLYGVYITNLLCSSNPELSK